jgi:ABC-type multidrug transport system fused ATPase/permease subunit
MKILKKIFNLLDYEEKKRALFLLILIFIVSIFDIIGIASVLPFISLLINPMIIENNNYLIYFYKKSGILGITSINQFLFVLGLGILILLITSIFLRLLTNYAAVRFALMREYSISRRLFLGYLYQPYIYFLNRFAADFNKNIFSEVNTVVNRSIVTGINLISHSITCLSLLILIFISTDPIIASIVILILFFFYIIIFYSIKKILSSIGFERLENNKLRFNIADEAFGAIKAVKLAGLENIYINRFSRPALIYSKNNSLSYLISIFPRAVIEAILFGGILILILTLIMKGNSFQDIIPSIVFYVFIGYRLIPALQQVYFSATQIYFSEAGIETLNKDLVSFQSIKKETGDIVQLPFSKSITLKKIYFNYPNSKILALKDINLTIPAFSKVGIVGRTGSGKTTLTDIILGLLDPKQGMLTIDENPITINNKHFWQKNIGYVPQEIYLANDTIAANIAFGLDVKNIDSQLIQESAKIANLHDFVINELPEKYNTIIGERGIRLSGGQRQRIAIARALYNKPKLLIFDEATSSLDNFTEKEVIGAIKNMRNKQITIIMIAHRLNTVKDCDVIFVLEKGELVAQGSYKELSQSSEVFKKISQI